MRVRGLLSVAMLLCASACGGASDSSGTVGSPSDAVKNPKSNEGSEALEAGFGQFLTKCDDSWFALQKNQGRSGQLYEYQNVEFLVAEQELTVADKANSVEFLGHISFGAEAIVRERFYSLGKDGVYHFDVASQWGLLEKDGVYLRYDGTPEYSIKKQNGNWDYSSAMPLNRPSEMLEGSVNGWPIGSKIFEWSKPTCDFVQEAKLDQTDAIFAHCNAIGLSEEVCRCRASTFKSQLSPFQLSALTKMYQMDDKLATEEYYKLSPEDQLKLSEVQDTAYFNCNDLAP